MKGVGARMDEIRLITKDTDLSGVKPFDWDLVIGGKPYYVCRIDGYSHSYAWNGGMETKQDLWCYPRNEKPSCDNLIEYSLKSPVAWGIEYREEPCIVSKYGETETRENRFTVITRNGEKFYTVGGGKEYSIIKAMYLLHEIQDHPLEFDAIDYDLKAVGRRIWYRGQKAVITRFVHGQCCIMIAREDGLHFQCPEEYKNEPWIEASYRDEKELKIDCLVAGHVNWFRD